MLFKQKYVATKDLWPLPSKLLILSSRYNLITLLFHLYVGKWVARNSSFLKKEMSLSGPRLSHWAVAAALGPALWRNPRGRSRRVGKRCRCPWDSFSLLGIKLGSSTAWRDFNESCQGGVSPTSLPFSQTQATCWRGFFKSSLTALWPRNSLWGMSEEIQNTL